MKLRKNLFVLRVLILLGLFFSANFLWWFYSSDRVEYLPLYILVAISISFKLIRIYFEWYNFFGLKEIEHKVSIERDLKVDVLTTAVPGEPIAMIEESLTAMVNMRYPHTTYLCDEGDDARLKEICSRLGVVHVTREVKKNAKAGNINNALQSATGEITVIMDPDHVPGPEFLEAVLPYFDDPDIGYVQAVQMYSNVGESWISEGAAQQTYMFYGPLMQAMGHYGTAQAIGANCTFRRSALDSIGGHAPGLTEDMHTSMLLHAKGWKSVYIPHVNTKGLVPDNISSYFKQQLKWSRGAFELYFNVLPGIFSRLTWRQKLHYALLPLHFAIGIVVLLDILVPIFSLFSGIAPVILQPREAFLAIIPFLISTIAIKLYAQRWLIGDNEAGLQLKGGILLFGSWWTFLKGLVYAILNVTVPYLPTPKRDGLANNVTGLLPNMILIVLGIAAITYNMINDWSPYSWFMAGFVSVNTGMLLLVIFFSQQLILARWERGLRENPAIQGCSGLVNWFRESIHKPVYRFCLKHSIALASFSMLIYAGGCYDAERRLKRVIAEKPTLSPFYLGMYMPEMKQELDRSTTATLNKLGGGRKIVSYYQRWGPDSAGSFPVALVNNISDNGDIAMITWEPWVGSFPERGDAPGLRKEYKAMKAIAEGKFDDYIRNFATHAREAGIPVMMRFAHEPDNPMYPWSPTGGNSPEDFKEAWRRVVSLFAEVGASNVSWVWTPWNPSNMGKYYPGDQFLDWVGFTILNYGKAAYDGKWRTMDEIYLPYRNAAKRMNKPVMFAEFGSTAYGGDQEKWMEDALTKTAERFPEVKALVFFNSGQDKNWITDWRPTPESGTIDWRLDDRMLQMVRSSPFSFGADKTLRTPSNRPNRSAEPGKHYQLRIGGQPFFVRGIAYNPGHGWQSGFDVLTRKSLRKDFNEIHQLGANTIRRYHPSRYDDLILDEAAKNSLKVIYGFWFEPDIDYLKDSAKVSAYYALVEKTVRKYKSNRAIIVWNLGNETGGLMKHHFHPPYLFQVRKAYIRMIDSMARRIHEIDKGSLVMSSLEHSWQLSGELHAFQELAPSLDVIGINSYYKDQISALDKLCSKFIGNKPYMISEFGPEGYWNHLYNRHDDLGFPLDEDDITDAQHMKNNWQNYVEGSKGANIGGVAFCWRERFEGSINWFGITDQRGRKKASYYALKEAWGDTSARLNWKKMAIVGPYSTIMPQRAYVYELRNPNAAFRKYEWKIYSEGTFMRTGKVRKLGRGERVEVSVPEKPGNYRLYVYAYDDSGNVITASKPVKVVNEVVNQGL